MIHKIEGTITFLTEDGDSKETKFGLIIEKENPIVALEEALETMAKHTTEMFNLEVVQEMIDLNIQSRKSRDGYTEFPISTLAI